MLIDFPKLSIVIHSRGMLEKRGYFKRVRLCLIFKRLKCVNDEKLMQNGNDGLHFKLLRHKKKPLSFDKSFFEFGAEKETRTIAPQSWQESPT